MLSRVGFSRGKQLQEETDWLDYGARMYQPELGRWFNMGEVTGEGDIFKKLERVEDGIEIPTIIFLKRLSQKLNCLE